jgi:hypothetical protein
MLMSPLLDRFRLRLAARKQGFVRALSHLINNMGQGSLMMRYGLSVVLPHIVDEMT